MKGGWQTRMLGEVATLQRGFDLPAPDRVAGRVPLVSSSGISDTHEKCAVRGPGVVTGRSGSIGNVFFIEEDFWPLNTTLYVKDFHGNDPRFVFYLLSKFDLRQFASGAGVPTLNRNSVHSEPVGVPPLPDQQRIVGILDEALAGIVIAKANAEKNLQNARALFDAGAADAFEQLPADWSERRLGDVCEIARGGSPRPIKAFLTDAEEGVNWIKISDASASSKYIYKTKQKIKPSGVSRSRLVHSGDFLLSNSMSFGRPYIMRTSGCIHDGWLVLSKYEETFDQDFLYLLLGSQFIYRQFDRLAAGSTVRNLNIELARSVTVPVPSLEVQKIIASELQDLSERVDRLEFIYQRKLDALDALKQSLLHQAFSGQL